jgi:hypothetical protein
MKTLRLTILVGICAMGLSAIAQAQAATPAKVTVADAIKHAGETVTVCGKVVDTKVSRYGIGGRGKPVNFDLEQPEPTPVFFFTTFGTQAGGPDEAIAAYKGKGVCVTGKIETEHGTPFMLIVDRTGIKVQTDAK